MKLLAVIDYGMGNLYSVSKGIERVGAPFFISADPRQLSKADGLILPGVGAFRDAMKRLEETGLKSFIIGAYREGIPIFGICLGMQLLFAESEENGLTKGFGFLPGRVVRFPDRDDYPVPHMGWNELYFEQPDHPLLKGITEGYAYFVHSYVVETDDPNIVLAASEYSRRVPAVVGRHHVFGTQFHPEKSGPLGMAILENFCRLVQKEGAIR